jgi:hypothetical protein
MARGDGKNKFYKHLELPKDLMKLIKVYNKVWKPKALSETKGIANGATGKTG